MVRKIRPEGRHQGEVCSVHFCASKRATPRSPSSLSICTYEVCPFPASALCLRDVGVSRGSLPEELSSDDSEGEARGLATRDSRLDTPQYHPLSSQKPFPIHTPEIASLGSSSSFGGVEITRHVLEARKSQLVDTVEVDAGSHTHRGVRESVGHLDEKSCLPPVP